MSRLDVPPSVVTAPPGWLADPRRRVTFDCATLTLLALTVAVCAIPALAAARPGVLLLGFCLVPGCAALTRLEVEGLAEAATLAVGFSLSLLTAGALVMVWTGWWHPYGWAGLLGAISALLLLVDLFGARGTWR
jgi:hypothetical protein